jgi:MoaA/NifB/PqqE/SkfB family radical SAM enzyme
MCYFSEPTFADTLAKRARLTKPDIERIAKVFFPWLVQLYVGCGTEPTTYKDFLSIVELGKQYNVPMVALVTNGQLLTEEHLTRFVELGLDELTLSTHGVEKDTYERLMRRASYDKFLSVLDQFSAIRSQHRSRLPELRINYTVNPENLNELDRFFDVYGKYSIQTLQIRPIADLGDTEFTDKNLAPHARKYNEVVHRIEQQCHARGIRLLANYQDISYSVKRTAVAFGNEVKVYLGPDECLPGFNWRDESYYEYRRRTNWSGHLLSKVFSTASTIQDTGTTLSYNVIE